MIRSISWWSPSIITNRMTGLILWAPRVVTRWTISPLLLENNVQQRSDPNHKHPTTYFWYLLHLIRTRAFRADQKQTQKAKIEHFSCSLWSTIKCFHCLQFLSSSREQPRNYIPFHFARISRIHNNEASTHVGGEKCLHLHSVFLLFNLENVFVLQCFMQLMISPLEAPLKCLLVK